MTKKAFIKTFQVTMINGGLSLFMISEFGSYNTHQAYRELCYKSEVQLFVLLRSSLL